eukprot:gb/GECG01007259.1/.p1 GENE.gb/GECG01007259.1/~~gb/GECG01007259.1/.p1  ORF type:complete len:106 (+),score=8.92 gb/GECG01007259.1/:1-318(+)
MKSRRIAGNSSALLAQCTCTPVSAIVLLAREERTEGMRKICYSLLDNQFGTTIHYHEEKALIWIGEVYRQLSLHSTGANQPKQSPPLRLPFNTGISIERRLEVSA